MLEALRLELPFAQLRLKRFMSAYERGLKADIPMGPDVKLKLSKGRTHPALNMSIRNYCLSSDVDDFCFPNVAVFSACTAF